MRSVVPCGTSTQPTLRPIPGGSSIASGAASNARLQRRRLQPRILAGAGDQHEEFVAAPAEHVVRFADVALQEARDVLQHPVARLVTERIVDGLEPVDVDEEQRERQLESDVPLQLAIDHLVEKAPIVTPGQRIGDRRLQELLARRLEPAVGHAKLVDHVLEHEEMDAEPAQNRQHDPRDENRERRLVRRVDAGSDTAVVTLAIARPSRAKAIRPAPIIRRSRRTAA